MIAADLTRRVLLSRLDAKLERPELREFKGNPIAVARRQRGELVVAALTILQAWMTSSAKKDAKPLGGYEEWSQRIREPLIWLGEEDPCKCMDAVWASDPYREELTAVLAQWRLKLVIGQGYTIKQVIERAIVDQDFYSALAAVAVNKAGTAISNDRLGRWLHKNAGKIAGGHRLEEGGMQASGKLWRCCKA